MIHFCAVDHVGVEYTMFNSTFCPEIVTCEWCKMELNKKFFCDLLAQDTGKAIFWWSMHLAFGRAHHESSFAEDEQRVREIAEEDLCINLEAM